MRFELYQVVITRADREVTGFIVAPDRQRASEIVIEREIMLNQENLGFMLDRVDETLPEDRQTGLQALLENAPAGIASYCEPLGWVAHATLAPRLYLYRIEEAEGDEHFIIAPNGNLAAAVYCEGVWLDEGSASLFRIHDGAIGLRNDALRGLPALLEFGPVGMVAWDDERGWSLV